MKIALLVLVIIQFCSCGTKKSNTAKEVRISDKNISSLWEPVTGSLIIDLSSVLLNESGTFNFIDADSQTIMCTCRSLFKGSKFSGTFNLDCTQCTDPQFNTIFVYAGTYHISNTGIATLCTDASDTRSCQSYH